MALHQKCNNSMNAQLKPSQQRLKELMSRFVQGDRCWMKHELALLSFKARGMVSDSVEAKTVKVEQSILAEMLRGM